jgi:hypothetical protein
MIISIYLSSTLHPSMYYFLTTLSIIDLCHSTVVTTKMLVNFMTALLSSSFSTFLLFQSVTCWLQRPMTAMSPSMLLYNIIKSNQACFALTLGIFFFSKMESEFLSLFRKQFCNFNYYIWINEPYECSSKRLSLLNLKFDKVDGKNMTFFWQRKMSIELSSNRWIT